MQIRPYHSDSSLGSDGFTFGGALAGLAAAAAVAALCVPMVARHLRARASAIDDSARRVESAVSRGLEGAGSLAEAYADSLAALPRPVADAGPAAASLPDRPPEFPISRAAGWAPGGCGPYFFPQQPCRQNRWGLEDGWRPLHPVRGRRPWRLRSRNR